MSAFDNAPVACADTSVPSSDSVGKCEGVRTPLHSIRCDRANFLRSAAKAQTHVQVKWRRVSQRKEKTKGTKSPIGGSRAGMGQATQHDRSAPHRAQLVYNTYR